MVDHIVDASELRGRVDIRVGVGRRRRRSDEANGRIVAESYASGAVVSEVARRHDISPQHLFFWRGAPKSRARRTNTCSRFVQSGAGRMSLPTDDVPAFVPVVAEPRNEAIPAPKANGCGTITIEIGGTDSRAAVEQVPITGTGS
jgi:transposase